MADNVYIALLRGINVGGKVLKMAELKDAVADLGFEDARTYLQSGNLVFRANKTSEATVASAITKAISEKCGMDINVIVRDRKAWSELIAANPFPVAAEKPKSVHAFLLDKPPEEQRRQEFAARDFGRDEWKIIGDALYMHTPDGFGISKLAQGIERGLKVAMTARNWNTVLALDAMAKEL